MAATVMADKETKHDPWRAVEEKNFSRLGHCPIPRLPVVAFVVATVIWRKPQMATESASHNRIIYGNAEVSRNQPIG